MITDAQGNRLTGASPAAAVLYDRAIAEFQCYRDDPLATLDTALEDSPQFAMGHILRAHLLLSATEKKALRPAAKSVERARACMQSERERLHIAALEAGLKSDFAATREGLEGVLRDHPRDAAALQMAHLWDFFTGDSVTLRDRIARYMPPWSEDVPGYHAVLAMRAFGLEETGDYARAEESGRHAIALEPADPWAQHAVAHVMEMQGRLDEGINWMRGNEANWTRGSLMAVHNWWHLGLYYLDLGDIPAVLDLYDRHIRGERSGLALDMLDASALLWRLRLRGVDCGNRWSELADDWDENLLPGFYSFNDAHAVMAFLGAGRRERAAAALADMREALGTGGGNDAMATDIGIPVSEALIAFDREDHARAVALLEPIRLVLSRFGGSHAQRDVFRLTLVEAAIRAGQGEIARTLADERLSEKPESPTNRLLAKRAAAAAASQ